MYPDIPRRTIPRYSPIPGPLEMAAGLLFTRRLGLLGAITLAAVAKQVSGAEIAAMDHVGCHDLLNLLVGLFAMILDS